MPLIDEILDPLDANIEFNNLSELENDKKNGISEQQAEYQQGLEEIPFEVKVEQMKELALCYGHNFLGV